jgi:3-hydroxyacyl-CoA dehydrogenase
MNTPVSLSKQDGIGLIIIDNPPVNALSQAVRQGLAECIRNAVNDEDISAMVLACNGKTFIAGADITEFGKPPLEPHLPDVLRLLDESPKPVVAALHGTVLGGGFETALACHYRVAAQGTRVGFPEVTLGLIPGAGGTQRLPRIVGVETALDMITSGKPQPVEKLMEAGGIDHIVAGDVREAAFRYACDLLDRTDVRPQRISERVVEIPPEREQVFARWRSRIERKYRGQISSRCAIDAVEIAFLVPFEEGLKKEREIFLKCRASDQSRALRHAFFAERTAMKLDSAAGAAEAAEVQAAGVVGAGTMGTGIAICLANAGIAVTLLEVGRDHLERGLEAITRRYARRAAQGRISEEQAAIRRQLIHGTCDISDLVHADLVIEAAFENMDVKLDIFTRLDAACRPDAVLATNTSYLDVNRIATATKKPERVLGLHFFSPADVMKLVEVVRAQETDDRTVATAMALATRMGKIPVPVGVCYGFVGNRMYACYGREGQMLLLEGATPEQIDAAMEDWGMAMGPMSVLDMSGLDISYKARRENPQRPDDPLYFRPADVLVEMGRLGRKTGAGFYRYDRDSGEKSVDPEVRTILRREAEALGVAQRDIDKGEIQERMIHALINEGAWILEEGIARRSGDIDVIWLNGYGFPRYRGGPMFYAADTGLGEVLEIINLYRQRYGDRYWKPAVLLEQSAAEGHWIK